MEAPGASFKEIETNGQFVRS
uniref:Uncharacterized protein n=1 Tax=Arundo donax TaxID=35708 RepID=A0A0A9GM90_ARUDO